MKRTTLFIEEALEAEVKALARRRGTAAAGLVREAIARYVAEETREETRVPRFLGAGRSGRRDVAERHEEILAKEIGRPGAAGGAAARASQRRRKG